MYRFIRTLILASMGFGLTFSVLIVANSLVLFLFMDDIAQILETIYIYATVGGIFTALHLTYLQLGVFDENIDLLKEFFHL